MGAANVMFVLDGKLITPSTREYDIERCNLRYRNDTGPRLGLPG